MSGYADRTGFGDPADPATMVWFGIQIGDSDSVPDWDVSPILPTRVIPGSNPPRSVTHYTGVEPATVTWRLMLDSRADLQLLRSHLGTEQTLSIIAGIQSLPGEYEDIHGIGYELLPATLLRAVSRIAVYVDGAVECDATFQRTVDPLTGEIVP